MFFGGCKFDKWYISQIPAAGSKYVNRRLKTKPTRNENDSLQFSAWKYRWDFDNMNNFILKSCHTIWESFGNIFQKALQSMGSQFNILSSIFTPFILLLYSPFVWSHRQGSSPCFRQRWCIKDIRNPIQDILSSSNLACQCIQFRFLDIFNPK